MRYFFALLAILFWPIAAEAVPQSSGTVIAVCGTVSPPFVVNRDGPITIDPNGQLCISGTINASNPSVSTTGAAVPASATYVAGNKSGNLVGVTLDGSSNLNVNCTVGCAGGSTSNATSGVATSSTNGASVAYNYGFNGTTWDQLQVDASKFLKVNVAAATTLPISAVSLPLPTLAATSTLQTSGGQKTQIVDGSGNVIASTSNNLNVQCANCSGSGASAADEASFTAGASTFAPSGGFFQTTATVGPLTTGQQGLVQMTATRAFFTNLRNAAGAEVGAAAVPLQVSLANTGANATAVLINQPTAANLNAAVVGVGTAGTASGGVLTIQGVASMTKLLVTPDSVALPANQSVNVSQINGVTPLMGNGVTGTGSQRVTIASDNTPFHTIIDSGSTTVVTGTVTASATLQTQTDTVMVGGVNVKEINAVTPLMGNGVTGTGSQRVTIASDNTAFSVNGTLQAQTDTVMVGGVNTKEINGVAPLMGNGVTGTGSLRVTLASDNTANSNPFLVTQVPSASAGGTTLFTLTLANTTNATNVKATPGQLYSISGFNMSSATPVWISLYNNAGTPTCGASIIQQFLIPGSTTGTGFVYDFADPKAFSSGIAFCATTGIAGTGAPAATTYVLNIDYK